MSKLTKLSPRVRRVYRRKQGLARETRVERDGAADDPHPSRGCSRGYHGQADGQNVEDGGRNGDINNSMHMAHCTAPAENLLLLIRCPGRLGGSGKLEHSLFWIFAFCIVLTFGQQTCDAFIPAMPSSLVATIQSGPEHRVQSTRGMISSGFSFSDGKQILVSLQKPLGILLEQDAEGPIIVGEVNQGGAADDAGIQAGDVLLAVQNASVENADLEEVLGFIGNAPRVINLRLLRKE